MSEPKYIEINCDVGEGIKNEERFFLLISSCSIACGGHFGNSATMLKTVRLAKSHQVQIGAHPSYPDRNNFGRLSMVISPQNLIDSIREQIKKLESAIAKVEGKLHHIKPHGALYNDIAKDIVLAKVFLKAIITYKNDVFLFVPYCSEIEKEALRQGFRIKYEAFADRNYNADLSLVSRKNPKALIGNKKEVLKHVTEIVKHKNVKTPSGERPKILAETFCIHSDTPSAFEILLYLTEELPLRNIKIKK